MGVPILIRSKTGDGLESSGLSRLLWLTLRNSCLGCWVWFEILDVRELGIIWRRGWSDTLTETDLNFGLNFEIKIFPSYSENAQTFIPMVLNRIGFSLSCFIRIWLRNLSTDEGFLLVERTIGLEWRSAPGNKLYLSANNFSSDVKHFFFFFDR